MNKHLTGEKRNLLTYLLLIVGVLSIIITAMLGQAQNDQFAQDSQESQLINQLLNQSKYNEAGNKLKELLQNYPDNYFLQWEYGLSLYNQGKIAQADQYYTKAREQRPVLVQNPTYLAQYGEVLQAEGQLDRAKKYLLEAKKVNTNPQLNGQIDKVLKSMGIEKK
ncbi:tetratricopeptide repeat protein [Aneurinibacillus terranovensis]|uniref:tetratricopeptide repeat protein n=1 Tax=Aneurinibacillus terranovensis TaxID=278991 RepID=UPI000484CC21|nr:hypothetical protein [Aneurinibacillus terranovensis]